MKSTRLISLGLTMILLQGCHSAEERKVIREEINELNIKAIQSPIVVGTLSTGQEIKRINIQYLCSNCSYPKEHYVYIVDNTISVNYDVPSGKSVVNEVSVTHTQSNLIDDKTILEMAEKIKKEIEDKDRAEYQRLKEKYSQ